MNIYRQAILHNMANRVIMQTVILNGIISAFFIGFGIIILFRNRKSNKNVVGNKLVTLSFFFLTFGLSLVVNLIYRIIDSYEMNLFLNKITIILASFSFIFLISFLILLRYSEVFFPTKKQIILYIVYFLLLSGLLFIPNGVEWEYQNGIGKIAYLSRNLEDLGDPHYSLAFGLYGIILNLIAFIYAIGTIIYIANHVKERSPQVYRKFLTGQTGVIHFGILLMSAFVAHLMATPFYRNLALIINLLGIPMSILIWLGFRKQMQK